MRIREINEGRSWKNDPSRCTQVTLDALMAHFGKPRTDPTKAPMHGTGVLHYIREAGLKFAPVIDYGAKAQTVKAWVAAHPKGAFYISTAGHAMAVIDGKLYDAENKGPNRRIVQSALEVYETDEQRQHRPKPIVIKVRRFDESVGQWPETISGEELAMAVEPFHHSPEDFDEGDIVYNIESFGQYHLQRVPLSTLNLELFTIHDDLVDEYSKMDGDAPPIVVNPQWGIIIDGNHRANAAAKRGDHDILAYVGDPSTYQKLERPEDE